MKTFYTTLLCFGLAHTVFCQKNNSIKIQDYKHISEIMQEGIQAAMNDEIDKSHASFGDAPADEDR